MSREPAVQGEGVIEERWGKWGGGGLGECVCL